METQTRFFSNPVNVLCNICSRLKSLMSSGKCVIGGETDESEKYIAPTVLTGVKPTDPLMENEVYQICTVTREGLKGLRHGTVTGAMVLNVRFK